MTKKLARSFFERPALEVAPDLLGKILVHQTANTLYKARIVEVEAYLSEDDRASHTNNYKKTARTEVLFGPAGHLYVYLTYGIHTIANIICGKEGVPEGVMLRALEPLEGYEEMSLNRYGKARDLSPYQRKNLTNGPGKLTQAMHITLDDYGTDLTGRQIYLLEDDMPSFEVLQGPRIGIAYAEEDSLLPYRFFMRGNPYVTEPKK